VALAPLDTNLSWLLSQANFALATEMTAALEELDLVPRGYCVLATALTGEKTQTELAQIVGLDKTTMVVTVDSLEAAGLAERRPSATDRRARVITVTAAGKRKVAEAEKVIERVQGDVLAGLPAEHRDALVESLAALVGGRLSTPCECEHQPRRRGAHA
jgi:MarR family transcriptional regulator for hemolysin